MPLMRLQKFLSAAGLCSRRKGEEYILKGLVRVNGELVKELGTKVDSNSDRVEFKGRSVQIKPAYVYIALNKPKGYVSSCKQHGKKIILDLVDVPPRIYPIGRLDEYSTGLILLTNDGELHHKLSHPSFDHEREYEVKTAAPITDRVLRSMEKGLILDGLQTRPAKIKRLSSRRFRIVLKEGRNRQIRRMVQMTGNAVQELKRTRMGPVKLGRLKEGSWRYLSVKEIGVLNNLT